MSIIKDTLEQRLGARIRAEREARGWSLTDLAERSAVSRAMIYKIERGDSSPTATLLAKLSGAFSLSMSTLLARAEASAGRLLRACDQTVWIDPQSGYVRRQISPKSDLPLDLVKVELPPGSNVDMPAAAYAFIRQLIWVLEGRLIFIEGTVRHDLHEGDCLALGPPGDCAFRNESELPCRYAVIVLSNS
jgi:transcriptional regulator with XRE-family HTH domain